MLAAAVILPTLAARVVLAHSHIPYIIINGEQFPGHNPKIANNPANIVGWTADNADDGPVNSTWYGHPDIICHRNASPAVAHAPVRAGDRIHIQWNGWPQGHVGPVLTYLARCGGGGGVGCADADKAALAFVKLDDSAPGLLGPGRRRWASDVLIARNNSWTVAVPRATPQGAYVLRHELLALHFAARPGGAQNYPLCLNLWVMAAGDDDEGGGGGGGSGEPPATTALGQGVVATALYRADDPGVLVDVAGPLSAYAIPGPPLDRAAEPIAPAAQTKSIATAYGTPVAITGGSTTVAMPVKGTFEPAHV